VTRTVLDRVGAAEQRDRLRQLALLGEIVAARDEVRDGFGTRRAPRDDDR
jgi:hypothetical protein